MLVFVEAYVTFNCGYVLWLIEIPIVCENRVNNGMLAIILSDAVSNIIVVMNSTVISEVISLLNYGFPFKHTVCGSFHEKYVNHNHPLLKEPN